METINNYSYVTSIGKFSIDLPDTIYTFQNNNFDLLDKLMVSCLILLF